MFQEEWHIQVALVQWLQCQHPKALFTASAGGMRTSIGTAVKMKRAGYKKGCPDILVFEPRDTMHGAFLELKRPGGRSTPEQETFVRSLQERGYACKVCYGFEEAREWLDAYLKREA